MESNSPSLHQTQGGSVNRADVGIQQLHDDGYGNTTAITNSSGSIVCNARYDAWGRPRNVNANSATCNTGTSPNDIWYRGGRRDPATGTYQWGSRLYNPVTASWLTPDTYRAGTPAQNLSVGTDPLTMNRYSYVNGDPINLIDPSGHEPCSRAPEGCRYEIDSVTAGRHRKAGTYEEFAAGVRRTRAARAARAKLRDCGVAIYTDPTRGISLGVARTNVGPGCSSQAVAYLGAIVDGAPTSGAPPIAAPPPPAEQAISAEGLEFIAQFESFEPGLYDDPTGNCTIGFGHLVHRGPCTAAERASTPPLSRDEALELLGVDAGIAARGVRDLITVPLNQQQFDSLVSFTFNVGVGALQDSRLRRLLNTGDYSVVPRELNRFVFSGGQRLPGLERRRGAEGVLFAQGDYGF